MSCFETEFWKFKEDLDLVDAMFLTFKRKKKKRISNHWNSVVDLDLQQQAVISGFSISILGLGYLSLYLERGVSRSLIGPGLSFLSFYISSFSSFEDQT